MGGEDATSRPEGKTTPRETTLNETDPSEKDPAERTSQSLSNCEVWVHVSIGLRIGTFIGVVGTFVGLYFSGGIFAKIGNRSPFPGCARNRSAYLDCGKPALSDWASQTTKEAR